MKISALTPDTRNANKGTPRGRKMVKESLQRYGAGRSILLDRSGNIIAGNKTVEGATALGMNDVQIVKSDGTKLVAVQRTDLDINDRKARELAIADNRAAEVGLEWDVDVLKELEVEGVEMEPFWDDRELVQFFARTGDEAPEPRIDQADELRRKWDVKPGQLWLIGDHRLLCGDSTKEGDVARLCNRSTAELVLTDPPYNVGLEYGESVDDSKESAEYLEWSRRWFAIVKCFAKCIALTPGITNTPMWIASIERTHRLIAWVKENQCSRNYIGATSGFNVWEPVLVYGKANKCVSRDAFSIPIGMQRSTGDHPCPKSLEAWKWLIDSLSLEGNRVLDVFLGSGTTMVACEQLKRTCYGLEIEPKYVAVTLQRLFDMGLQPVLENA